METLQADNATYKRVAKMLSATKFKCGICRTECTSITSNSIVIKDFEIVYVLNYCPNCEQRFPIKIENRDISITYPPWKYDNIYPNKRMYLVKGNADGH